MRLLYSILVRSYLNVQQNGYLLFTKAKVWARKNYIRDVNIRTHRIILSKMRISNHRLAIETGRFSKTPRNERVCLFCKANNNFSEIEDEQHMLLRSSRYTKIRRDLFDRVRKCCPRIDLLNDENKFMYLLNSSDSTIKDVARIFHSAYKARSA